MKKLLYLVLSLIMLAGTFLTPFTAYAVESSEETALYVVTKKCPDGYIEYANSNIQDFILSVDPLELQTSKNISIGTPFSFANPDSDVFYFPIIMNGEIIYMLRVFQKESGEYDGVLGKSYVSDLNEALKKTSNNQPLVLMMEGDSVVTYIGEDRSVIFEYPDGTIDCRSNVPVADFSKVFYSKNAEYEVVDAIKKNNRIDMSVFEDLFASRNELRESGTPSYKYLSTTITETQGSNSWCAAYATAWIIRYVKGNNDNTAALDVMNYHFSNPTSSDSIGEAEVVEYANYRSIYPTHIKSTLSNSSLIAQIVASKPVYLRMYRTVGSEKKYHAIVLRGYSNNTSKWSVWNPWYNYYDSFSMGGTYIPAEHQSREYTYCHTIYNW